MITRAQLLNITEFPYFEYGESGLIIYFEHSGGFWWKREYDNNDREIKYEDSYGNYWTIEMTPINPFLGKNKLYNEYKYRP